MNHAYMYFFLFSIKDPRLKALSEAKYTQFKTWFDQRLDDAIAAAEQPPNNQLISTNGKYAQCASLGTFYQKFSNYFFLFRCVLRPIRIYRKIVLRYDAPCHVRVSIFFLFKVIKLHKLVVQSLKMVI